MEPLEDLARKPAPLWQKIRNLLVGIVVIALLVGVLVLLILIGYRFNWTGFLTKTLWDWMELLLVPFMLAVGGFWLNQIQKSREESTTAQRAEIERKLAQDNQQEALLQAYIDKMSELLLEEHLDESTLEGKSKPEYKEVQKIARIRTLTVLPHLNSSRKRSLLQFLYESNLISIGSSVVDLKGADLSKAALREVNLRLAELSGANFSGADLFKANLFGANLFEAELSSAILSKADLSGAHLSGALLSKADLSKAELIQADLSGAHLSEALLMSTDLHDANLSGANLSKADLSEADMSGANLYAAYLDAANLSGATITHEQLDKTAHAIGVCRLCAP